jgi:hypothetical protein
MSAAWNQIVKWRAKNGDPHPEACLRVEMKHAEPKRGKRPKDGVRGERNGMAVMNSDQVRAMRRAYREKLASIRDLSKIFGFSIGAVYNAVHRRTYEDVGD